MVLGYSFCIRTLRPKRRVYIIRLIEMSRYYEPANLLLKQSMTAVFLSYQKFVDCLLVSEVPQILSVITRRTQGGYSGFN